MLAGFPHFHRFLGNLPVLWEWRHFMTFTSFFILSLQVGADFTARVIRMLQNQVWKQSTAEIKPNNFSHLTFNFQQKFRFGFEFKNCCFTWLFFTRYEGRLWLSNTRLWLKSRHMMRWWWWRRVSVCWRRSNPQPSGAPVHTFPPSFTSPKLLVTHNNIDHMRQSVIPDAVCVFRTSPMGKNTLDNGSFMVQ